MQVTRTVVTGKTAGAMRRILVLVLGLSPIVLSMGLLAPDDSLASPLSEKRARAKEIQRQIMRLDDQTEMAVERYNVATEQLSRVRARISDNRRQLRITRYNLQLARRQLADRAVAMYKQPPTGVLDMLFAAKSFDDLATQLDLMRRLGRLDANIVRSIESLKRDVLVKREALLTDRKQAEALVAQRTKEKTEVLASLQQRKEMLRGVESEIKRLEDRAAAAARAAALAAPASSAVAADPVGPAVTAGPGRSGAVAIAQRYLGVPYVWGGATPAGFDCSGLTMYVFAQLGISLPHSAAGQYNYGTHVSRSQLQAGDLVFFGLSAAGIHHVGIYVGNGMMIDAPRTGEVVRYSPITYHYFGATRL